MSLSTDIPAGSAAKQYDGACSTAADSSQSSGTSARSADAARSGYIVRSPPESMSTTTVPVLPRRCTRTSTPCPASSLVSTSAAGSSPTQPMNRAGIRALANTATFAALPPRERRMTQGLSVGVPGGRF